MVEFIIGIVVIAISLLIISKLPLGVEIDSAGKALAGGAVIGILHGIASALPLSQTLSFISVGLIPLIGGIIIFGLAAWLIEGFRLKWGIWSAILGSIALTIINAILRAILGAIGIG